MAAPLKPHGAIPESLSQERARLLQAKQQLGDFKHAVKSFEEAVALPSESLPATTAALNAVAAQARLASTLHQQPQQPPSEFRPKAPAGPPPRRRFSGSGRPFAALGGPVTALPLPSTAPRSGPGRTDRSPPSGRLSSAHAEATALHRSPESSTHQQARHSAATAISPNAHRRSVPPLSVASLSPGASAQSARPVLNAQSLTTSPSRLGGAGGGLVPGGLGGGLASGAPLTAPAGASGSHRLGASGDASPPPCDNSLMNGRHGNASLSIGSGGMHMGMGQRAATDGPAQVPSGSQTARAKLFGSGPQAVRQLKATAAAAIGRNTAGARVVSPQKQFAPSQFDAMTRTPGARPHRGGDLGPSPAQTTSHADHFFGSSSTPHGNSLFPANASASNGPNVVGSSSGGRQLGMSSAQQHRSTQQQSHEGASIVQRQSQTMGRRCSAGSDVSKDSAFAALATANPGRHSTQQSNAPSPTNVNQHTSGTNSGNGGMTSASPLLLGVIASHTNSGATVASVGSGGGAGHQMGSRVASSLGYSHSSSPGRNARSSQSSPHGATATADVVALAADPQTTGVMSAHRQSGAHLPPAASPGRGLVGSGTGTPTVFSRVEDGHRHPPVTTHCPSVSAAGGNARLTPQPTSLAAPALASLPVVNHTAGCQGPPRSRSASGDGGANQHRGGSDRCQEIAAAAGCSGLSAPGTPMDEVDAPLSPGNAPSHEVRLRGITAATTAAAAATSSAGHSGTDAALLRTLSNMSGDRRSATTAGDSGLDHSWMIPSPTRAAGDGSNSSGDVTLRVRSFDGTAVTLERTFAWTDTLRTVVHEALRQIYKSRLVGKDGAPPIPRTQGIAVLVPATRATFPWAVLQSTTIADAGLRARDTVALTSAN